jgi:cytochrome c-type biogenesis protein CcmF
VASGIVGLLVEQIGRRHAKTGESLWHSTKKIVGGDQRFWAGQLSHIGLVLVAIGIAFAANLGVHSTAELRPGDSVQFAGYDLTYDSPFRRQDPNRVVQGARIRVTRDGELESVLEPRANFYGADTSGVSTPAVLSTAKGDLYLTLRDLDNEHVELALDTSPLIWMLWFGGLTTAAGGFWAMKARGAERKSRTERQSADV